MQQFLPSESTKQCRENSITQNKKLSGAVSCRLRLRWTERNLTRPLCHVMARESSAFNPNQTRPWNLARRNITAEHQGRFGLTDSLMDGFVSLISNKMQPHAKTRTNYSANLSLCHAIETLSQRSRTPHLRSPLWHVHRSLFLEGCIHNANNLAKRDPGQAPIKLDFRPSKCGKTKTCARHHNSRVCSSQMWVCLCVSRLLFLYSNCPLPLTASSQISILLFFFYPQIPFYPCFLVPFLPPPPSPFVGASHLSHDRMCFPDSPHYCRALSLFSERVPISLYNAPNPCTFCFGFT